MFFMYSESHWRADRAAEGDGLENRCVSNGTGGSNPSPSALICVATLCVQCRDTFLCISYVVDGVALAVLAGLNLRGAGQALFGVGARIGSRLNLCNKVRLM